MYRRFFYVMLISRQIPKNGLTAKHIPRPQRPEVCMSSRDWAPVRRKSVALYSWEHFRIGSYAYSSQRPPVLLTDLQPYQRTCVCTLTAVLAEIIDRFLPRRPPRTIILCTYRREFHLPAPLVLGVDMDGSRRRTTHCHPAPPPEN